MKPATAIMLMAVPFVGAWIYIEFLFYQARKRRRDREKYKQQPRDEDPMMLYNPIIAMIYNLKLKTWHPVLFIEAPLPGPYSSQKPVRHRSKGHRTEGFLSREDALLDVVKLVDQVIKTGKVEFVDSATGELKEGSIQTCLEADLPWDGEGIPAMTMCFQPYKLTPFSQQFTKSQ